MHALFQDMILRNHEIHIWQADLNLSESWIQRLAPNLSVDEQRKVEQLYFTQDKKHFVACRGLLRLILGRYLDQPPNQLEFSYRSRGKPELACHEIDEKVNFNVSHSNGLALFAFARDRPVGIDLEYIRPIDAEKLAQRFFSPHEYAKLDSLNPEEKPVAFFNGWTRKEAYLKAIGGGIAGLKQVEVTLAPGEPAKLLRIAGEVQAASHWSLYQLFPAFGYVAALAVEGCDWQLRRLAIFPQN